MAQKYRVILTFETDADAKDHAEVLISTYLWGKGVPQYPDNLGNKGYQIHAEKI